MVQSHIVFNLILLAQVHTPLTKQYNASLSGRAFSSEWKHLYITPVHKGRPSVNPYNFSPISVVPMLAKVLVNSVRVMPPPHLL